MHDLNTAVAHKLKTLREFHRLTQSQMAERIGVAMRSYQKYESGERFPKGKIIDNICSEFSITRAELFSTGGEAIREETFTAEEAAVIIQKLSHLSVKNRGIMIKAIDQMLSAQEGQAKRKAN